MSKTLSFVLLASVYLIGIVIFLRGFFPIKAPMQGFSKFEDYGYEPGEEEAKEGNQNVHQKEPKFRKLVMILIDALRSDFVLQENSSTDLAHMGFLSDQVKNGATYSFTAKAHPPTVTLPRVKALTTGGIPGFVDVVLNFDSKSLYDDNVITQMKRAEKNMVFYGDDTWLNLFPDHFTRSDGTTSFFVTDYIEVDNNVTRHLASELALQDWDVMILHYLGLDHIGHLAGPRSPLIKPKLDEMDNIVKDIYFKLVQEDEEIGVPSLMIVFGDHGMSDQGSHGGSSVSETLTPVVLLSTVFEGNRGKPYYALTQDIYQIDIVPTLSILMGIPIPQNNLGVVNLKILEQFSLRSQLQKVYQNAQQIAKIFEKYDPNFNQTEIYRTYTRAVTRHTHWLKQNRQESNQTKSNIDMTEIARKTLHLYQSAMIDMRNEIAGSLSSYDLHAMGFGITITWMVLIIFITRSYMNDIKEPTTTSLLVVLPLNIAIQAIFIGVQLAVCTSKHRSHMLCSINEWYTWVSLIVFCMTLWTTISVLTTMCRIEFLYETELKKNWTKRILLISTLCHTISMLSSSFIEEEHQTWYFFTVTLNFFIFVTSVKRYVSSTCSNVASPSNYHKVTSGMNPLISDGDNIVDVRYTELSYKNGDTGSRSSDINVTKRNKQQSVRSDTESEEKYSDESEGNSRQREMFAVTVYCVIIIMLCRVCRGWNRTGDKWAHIPDIGDWLIKPENKVCLSITTALSLVCVMILSASKFNARQNALISAALLYVYMYRATTGDVYLQWLYNADAKTKGLSEARTIYFILALMLMNTVIESTKAFNHAKTAVQYIKRTNRQQSKKPNWGRTYIANETVHTVFINVHTMWLILMLLLVRTHNVGLVAMQLLQLTLFGHVMKRTRLDIVSSTVVYLWMGQAAFFYQGNSNSLAAVDVSAGYIGLDSYQPVLIGILLALATYAGPILWIFSLLVNLTSRLKNDLELEVKEPVLNQIKENHIGDEVTVYSLQDVTQVVTTILVCRCLPMAVYMVLVTVERYHLFVWTVFSPKLLYEGMSSLVMVILSVLILFSYRAIDFFAKMTNLG